METSSPRPFTARLRSLFPISGSKIPSSGAVEEQKSSETCVSCADAQGGVQERAIRPLRCKEDILSVTLRGGERCCFSGVEFDTVVDTFGLCSCADPVAALRQMAEVPR
jgi:hypothetical protein